ncbi:unannotated protein [freshwater metagenome]|uniref:Unannotated protein n=1 Tax=freshwater metagenome TaxID=449393 RepID=A0A6J6CZY2_9ZZZZ
MSVFPHIRRYVATISSRCITYGGTLRPRIESRRTPSIGCSRFEYATTRSWRSSIVVAPPTAPAIALASANRSAGAWSTSCTATPAVLVTVRSSVNT